LSPAAVKSRFAASRPPEETAERLAREKERLERTIRNLRERLGEVERALAELGKLGAELGTGMEEAE
jgi:prefoldin subunit 5